MSITATLGTTCMLHETFLYPLQVHDLPLESVSYQASPSELEQKITHRLLFGSGEPPSLCLLQPPLCSHPPSPTYLGHHKGRICSLQTLFFMEIFQPQPSGSSPRSAFLSREQHVSCPRFVHHQEEAHTAPRRNKPLQRGLAFIYFSRRKAALGGCVRACVRVFVSGQWEKGQWSGAARKHSAICPCRKQFFLSFCMERNVAESRHPPVLGGNLSDFALPGRGSVGEGASAVPVVKRSLHSRPIKAGKKALPKPPNPREKLLFLLHPFTCGLLLSRSQGDPEHRRLGRAGLRRANQHKGFPALAARRRKPRTEKNQLASLCCLSAHTLFITRNLAI